MKKDKDKKESKKRILQILSGFLTWTIIIIIIGAIVQLYQQREIGYKKLSFTQFYSKLDKGEIKKIFIEDGIAKGIFTNGDKFKTVIPMDAKFIEELAKMGIDVEIKKSGNIWKTILPYLPLFLLFFLWLALLRQAPQMPTGALTFTKVKPKTSENIPKVTFKDVAGVDEAIEELKEIVEFLKNPDKFKKIGARVPKGILLVGPPGTGKTLLAKAVAGEAGVPFFSVSGSEFVELFVGVGAARVRDLFEKAKRNAPAIAFIDEIDAVGRHRGAGLGGGHDEREQTLNELLVQMDGFDPNEGIIVMAATNRPDILDRALLRPGRFDRKIVLDLPDVKGREEIFKVHLRKIKVSKNVDVSILARSTPGFSGADIANLVNEAALLAARRKKNKVDMQDFEDARDKIVMGTERKILLSERERKLIAYHEAGHAICAKFEKEADPVHKITIMPRGMALGATQNLPTEDRRTFTKEYLMATITVLLGGRAAEKIALNTMTSGAGNDLERATELARKMVCEWGMSELGPMTFGKRKEEVFLGKEIVHLKDYSEETAKLIDDEVHKILTECEKRAEKIIKENEEKLHRLAKALLEYETLTGEEIDKVLKGEKIEKRKKNGGKRVKSKKR